MTIRGSPAHVLWISRSLFTRPVSDTLHLRDTVSARYPSPFPRLFHSVCTGVNEEPIWTPKTGLWRGNTTKVSEVGRGPGRTVVAFSEMARGDSRSEFITCPSPAHLSLRLFPYSLYISLPFFYVLA